LPVASIKPDLVLPGKHLRNSPGFDFLNKFGENNPGITNMKDLFKSFLTIMLISAAFVVGFQLGKEREKQKIPKFQEDHGDIDAVLD
jgi:hypothetical protein